MWRILKRERSEEEKLRRHLYGDKGGRFQAKVPCIDDTGVIGTITTLISKDLLLVDVED